MFNNTFVQGLGYHETIREKEKRGLTTRGFAVKKGLTIVPLQSGAVLFLKCDVHFLICFAGMRLSGEDWNVISTIDRFRIEVLNPDEVCFVLSIYGIQYDSVRVGSLAVL
ncbi:hypothetical protein M0R45_020160 [Rubus argutus]|uniref:Uncharacterized protein n=1 Tax=Rubus argutus TaxID=59490 RepID=A0AAW1X7I3_RUBAR